MASTVKESKAQATLVSPKSKKKRRTWSQESRVNEGLTKRIEVRELDNVGYLVTYSVYGSNEKGEYIDERSEQYSEENPLAVKEDTISALFNEITRK